MFQFFTVHTILERGVNAEEMEEKYPDKVMIVINERAEREKGGKIFGDIVAIITPEEYNAIDFPENSVLTYAVWRGKSLLLEGLGVAGIYL